MEERGRATIIRRSFTDVVGGEYQPPSGLTILVNNIFDEARITSGFLKKERLQEIQVNPTYVECLSAASTTLEVSAGYAF